MEQLIEELARLDSSLTEEKLAEARAALDAAYMQLGRYEGIYKRADDFLHKPRNIQELMNKLINPKQIEILERVNTRVEEERLYIIKYEPTPADNRRSKAIGAVHILGAFNRQKNKREDYEVKIYRDNSMYCSCPSHKFNSSKHNTLCKHISYVICRVGLMYDPTIFNTKKLTDQQVASLLARFDAASDLWNNKDLLPPVDVTQESFRNGAKPMDPLEMCPICYCEYAAEPCVSCPTCNNYIHTDCMNVWLERKNTCVMCRSDVWKLYRA